MQIRLSHLALFIGAFIRIFYYACNMYVSQINLTSITDLI